MSEEQATKQVTADDTERIQIPSDLEEARKRLNYSGVGIAVFQIQAERGQLAVDRLEEALLDAEDHMDGLEEEIENLTNKPHKTREERRRLRHATDLLDDWKRKRQWTQKLIREYMAESYKYALGLKFRRQNLLSGVDRLTSMPADEP